MVVGGDPEARHGIVLAKTDEAKKTGIKTGMVLWEAKQKCPGLVCLSPDYKLYIKFSRMVRSIFDSYTDQVEPFGLDECWLDVSEPGKELDHGVMVADEIRGRIWRELGITASVGVGHDKIMAKLGSDYRKPDATTLMGPEEMKTLAWSLPASDLLYVGPATAKKLARIGVTTIGRLAAMEPDQLQSMLGKPGVTLWVFANAMDTSPVRHTEPTAVDTRPMESIGNSTTTPRDLVNDEDVKLTFYLLSESVAERLRDCGLRARVIEISVRDNQLYSFVRQHKIQRATYISAEIAEEAMRLFRKNYSFEKQRPLRSIGVRGSDLETADKAIQLSMFIDEGGRVQQETLERTLDDVRRRFGNFSIRRGMMFKDTGLSGISPKDDHVIHPLAYL